MSLMRCIIVASVISLAVAPAKADLIVNGSFEAPLVPVGGFTNFGAGSTAITGWRVVGVDSAVTSGTFTQSGIVFQAQDGIQWLDLAGVTSNSMSSGVTQDVATILGEVYELNFYVGSATGGGFFFPATVDLSINGSARVSYFNPTGPANSLDWKLFSVPFTATGTTTKLTFFNGSASNNFLGALDKVSLNAVPEPASVILLGIGGASMVVIGIARRRRRIKSSDCETGETGGKTDRDRFSTAAQGK